MLRKTIKERVPIDMNPVHFSLIKMGSVFLFYTYKRMSEITL